MLGKKIALYRKKMKYTQAQLGDRLGVSNQAISKWESGASYPDIMLLPKISEVLHVSLDELFGKEKAKVRADAFPESCYNQMVQDFFDQSGVRIGKTEAKMDIASYFEALQKGCLLGCISDRKGAAVVSAGMAFVDRDFRTEENAELLSTLPVISVLEVLSQNNCRTILAFHYKKAISLESNKRAEFTLQEFCDNCGLTETEAFESLEKLTSIQLEEKRNEIGKGMLWCLNRSGLVYLDVILKAAQLMITDPCWFVVRDTSMISDYGFEKLWDK